MSEYAVAEQRDVGSEQLAGRRLECGDVEEITGLPDVADEPARPRGPERGDAELLGERSECAGMGPQANSPADGSCAP